MRSLGNGSHIRKQLHVLSLGCGRVKRDFPEADRATSIVGVDNDPHSDADIMHDLNQFPYPLEANSFDLIILQDVLEHLEDVPRVLQEVHRVGRSGATIRIRTPHYSSYYAFNDPTHRHYFGALFLNGFDVISPNPVYGGALFQIKSRKILFPRVWRMTGVAAMANTFPLRWEQLFAFVFRAENMLFELLAIKPEVSQGVETTGTLSTK